MSTWTIAKKELNSYFRSPIAYGVMAFFALIAGYFFYVAVVYFVRRGIESSMMGQSFPMDVNEFVVRPVFSNISVIGLFLIPMITMRLFAEEKRTGTIELLLTSPISDLSIILGKWIGGMILYTAMLGLSALSMLVLFAYGQPDWHPIAIGYLGLLLQGGALLAIGTFISNCTKNQIVAGVAGFAICLLLWVLDWVSSFETSIGARILSYLSVLQHFDSFGKGVLDSKDIIYYLSVIFVGLFLTARSMESLRWRA
ncbi:MAG TPA: ABC transporter permease subunit [Bryobacteraceae bacterium]|jgi:ABC-2 type transport system permease protein|nr:ABC transporter permease subunit [Bryobacteraceae bacterium]